MRTENHPIKFLQNYRVRELCLGQTTLSGNNRVRTKYERFLQELAPLLHGVGGTKELVIYTWFNYGIQTYLSKIRGRRIKYGKQLPRTNHGTRDSLNYTRRSFVAVSVDHTLSPIIACYYRDDVLKVLGARVGTVDNRKSRP